MPTSDACAEQDVIRARVELARLAARGLISAAECRAALIAAGRAAAPARDPAGLRMRVAHILADTISAERRARALAEARVAAALRPALRAGIGRAGLLRAAETAARGVFEAAELLTLTEREVIHALHRGDFEH